MEESGKGILLFLYSAAWVGGCVGGWLG